MSGTKRKIFGAEFKAKVGLEAIHGVKTVNQIAQEYGVHPTQVGQWKKEILGNAGSLFEGKRGPKAVDEYSEPERLYGEIGRLKMELDWLKKSPGWAITNHLATVFGLPSGMASSFISSKQARMDRA
jgi:transposase